MGARRKFVPRLMPGGRSTQVEDEPTGRDHCNAVKSIQWIARMCSRHALRCREPERLHVSDIQSRRKPPCAPCVDVMQSRLVLEHQETFPRCLRPPDVLERTVKSQRSTSVRLHGATYDVHENVERVRHEHEPEYPVKNAGSGATQAYAKYTSPVYAISCQSSHSMPRLTVAQNNVNNGYLLALAEIFQRLG